MSLLLGAWLTALPRVEAEGVKRVTLDVNPGRDGDFDANTRA
jgi:hypothetical protein